MKTYLRLFSFIFLFFFIVHCQATQQTRPSPSNIALFQSARKTGNLEQMAKATAKLAQEGVIYKSMTAEALQKVLGDPDHGTGIYIPEGYSIGYGNKTPTAENYPDFYWFHFKQIDKDGKEIYILELWENSQN